MPNRWWVLPGVAAAAVVLAACGSSGSPTGSATSNPPAAGNAAAVVIKTMSTSKGMVLANPAGLTLYWFANDTASQSNCTGSCAQYWPPVLGSSASAKGLPHGFGTIKRANGQTQLTYDGHPLYTYSGDTSAGQINGNGLSLSGGLWWAITPSGAELGATTAATGSGSGSSGSGGSGSGGSSGSGGGSGGW
jgi:predicted lipoprotein with Yx(FWY)xxD motif